MIPNLFAHNPQLGGSKQDTSENETATLHPCLESGLNCGEGGCFVNRSTGTVACLCLDFTVPDESGRCPPSDDNNPIGPSHIPQVPDLPLVGFGPESRPFSNVDIHRTKINATNHSSSAELPVSNVNTDAQPAASMMYIMSALIPFAILLLTMVVGVVLFALRRKARSRRRYTARDSAADLFKQDRSHLLDHMTVVGKNQNYSLCVDLNRKLNKLQVTHIPSDKLKLMEEIGEGAFGKVYKGEVKWSDERSTFVAVKILKQDASMETQTDFVREVQIMCSFNHENILSLMGIVNFEAGSPFMVFELMEHGDLTDLLRKNDPSKHGSASLQLSKVDLVDIATQIANGMCYLSDQHFVHRDLATRNCLVGDDLRVKISDFGMSRDIYTCDYYKIGGARLLPVRWMSPESVKYGRFTTESDVWSFGVTLWEIFTYGKQPYYGHGNEEVIRLLDDGILLQRPDHCPDDVFSVMLACWRTDVTQRFSFKRIYHHLCDIKNRYIACYPEHSHSTQTDPDCPVQLHMVQEA